MHTPQHIWRQVTPKAQLLIVLALATVLAFSAGLAAGIYGRSTYLPAVTTDRNTVPTVAQPPQAAAAVQQRPVVAVPPRAPILPVSGIGTAYDWDHYGSPSAPQTSPNVPISGTGSAYDGKHYGGMTAPTVALDAAQQGMMDYVRAHDAVEGQQAPATVNPNVPAIGTGSVYDGGHYGAVPQISPNVVSP
jgi:hypothetical protein